VEAVLAAAALAAVHQEVSAVALAAAVSLVVVLVEVGKRI
jgi:hypothetical protein